MAETSGFFNSQVDEEGTYDRVYLAGDFADYFSSLISNGIFGGKLNELQVIADSGMNVLVRTGRAFIEGYWYQNSKPLRIEIPVNTTIRPQAYAIAIRLDKTQRSINVVLKGPSDNTNEVITPTRNDSIYELTLALINLPTGLTSINQQLIIDKRAIKDLCGFVTGLIEQIDTTEFATQLDMYIQALKDAIESDIQNITNDTPAMLKSVYDKDNDGVVDKSKEIQQISASNKSLFKPKYLYCRESYPNFITSNQIKAWFRRLPCGLCQLSVELSFLSPLSEDDTKYGDLEFLLPLDDNNIYPVHSEWNDSKTSLDGYTSFPVLLRSDDNIYHCKGIMDGNSITIQSLETDASSGYMSFYDILKDKPSGNLEFQVIFPYYIS